MAERSLFAQELKVRLAASSLSAEDVVHELMRHGFPVPQHTFAYWLQGYFLPRSEAAFQLVSVLENILGGTTSLSDALLADLSSGHFFVPGENAPMEMADSYVQHDSFSENIDNLVDWEATLLQKVVNDELWISADCRHVKCKTTIFGRIPHAPNPIFFYQVSFEDATESPGSEELFYDVSGMKLKKCDVIRRDGRTIYAAQFSLPDNVVPGDLHKLSYTWDEKLVRPESVVHFRFLPWVLDFYSASITFEGGVPEGVRFVTRKNRDDKDMEVSNDIPIVRSGKTVSISVKNFGNIVGYFEIPTPATQ